MKVLPYVRIEADHSVVVVTRSREAGLNQAGQPHFEPLVGSVQPDADKLASSLAREYEKNLFHELKLDASELYFAGLNGSAAVAFTDDLQAQKLTTEANGYQTIEDVDAIFGHEDTVKACRLGDCGLLLIEGIDQHNKRFNGFIHVTRLNLNGDDQFVYEGKPVGGVELMLKRTLRHYQPASIQLRLVAGIAPEFYLHQFEASARDDMETYFKDWWSHGWLRPHNVDGGWDRLTYEADLYAALRFQVERAGLLSNYDNKQIALDGNPASGHASHRAAARGLVAETRDVYLVIPNA